MAHDTLVVLCKNINDAIIASSRIHRRYDSKRLFIFLGKKPTTKELSWLTHTDDAFTLEKALDWAVNPEILGVRAGLMFATGWDLIFMWAHDCPSNEDIDWIKSKLKTDGMAKLSNVWGMTRDHYILHGLGEEQVSFTESAPLSEAQLGLKIADALDGKPCTPEIAFIALEQTSAISPVYIHPSADADKHKLISNMFRLKSIVDNDACVSAVVGEDCTLDELQQCQQKIANHGVVYQLLTDTGVATSKPYKTIKLESKDKIVLYGKR